MKTTGSALKTMMMFVSLLLAGCMGRNHSALNSHRQMIDITIQCTYTESYCGGAYPPDELLAELARPKPLGSTALHIRTSADNKNHTDAKLILSAITDAEGLVHITLPEGNYVLVFDDKKDRTRYNEILERYSQKTQYTDAVDRKCLQQWIETPELLLSVTAEGGRVFNVNHHKVCSWYAIPCVEYRGPLPP